MYNSDIEIDTYYDQATSCLHVDSDTAKKLKLGVKRHGYIGSLNELYRFAQEGEITWASYYESKRDYNEHVGRDINFMVPEEYKV